MNRNNGYVRLGLAAFFTVGTILLFYDTMMGGRELLKIWQKLLSALQPVLLGAFLAYLLAPAVNFFQDGLGSLIPGKSPRRWALLRTVSLLLTWAVIAFLVYLLASVLLPELYKSVIQLVSNIENYYRTVYNWVDGLLRTNPTLESWMAAQMEKVYTELETWVQNTLLPRATEFMSLVSGGLVSSVRSVVSFFSDLLVGMIVSIYFLATKERCGASARKIAYGLFSREHVYWLLRGVHKVDRIFSGFVRGKLLDSLIIGVLCFVGASILKFPYTPLVSVIVGVTNIIPFFGPFLGAIPSTFLILLASPIKALYFLVFVLALQQLDGNVIGPKILGDKTGLSSLWVIVAILVGGSFFGIAGMFFGVPVCACLYSAVNFLVNARLQKRGLPLEEDAYRQDQPAGAPSWKPEEEPQEEKSETGEK